LLGDLEKPFLLAVEDAFSISGRGTVATGMAERGVAKKGEEVEIIGYGANFKTTLTGIGSSFGFVPLLLLIFHRDVPQGA